MQSRNTKENSPTLVEHHRNIIPTSSKERGFEYRLLLDEPIPIPTPQISNMNNSFTYSTLQEYIEGYAVLYTHQLAIYYRAGQIERSTMLTLLDIIFYDEKKSSNYYLDKLDDGNDIIQTKISLLQPMDTLLNEIMLLAGYIQFMKLKGYTTRKQSGLDIKSHIYFDQGIENQTTKYLLAIFRTCTEINLLVETSLILNSNNNNNNNNRSNNNNNNNNNNSSMMMMDCSEPITTNCKNFKIELTQSMETWNTRGIIPYNYQMAKMFPDHPQYSFYSTKTAWNMLLPKYRQSLSEFINEFISSNVTISCVYNDSYIVNNINNNNENNNNNNNNNNNFNNGNGFQLVEIVFCKDELSAMEYDNLLDFMIGEFYRAFYEHKKTLKKSENESLVNSLVSLLNPLLFYFIYHHPNKFNFKNL